MRKLFKGVSFEAGRNFGFVSTGYIGKVSVSVEYLDGYVTQSHPVIITKTGDLWLKGAYNNSLKKAIIRRLRLRWLKRTGKLAPFRVGVVYEPASPIEDDDDMPF